jgi:hypothetical protein
MPYRGNVEGRARKGLGQTSLRSSYASQSRSRGASTRYDNAAGGAASALHLETTSEQLRQDLHDIKAPAFRRRDIKAGWQFVTVIGDR